MPPRCEIALRLGILWLLSVYCTFKPRLCGLQDLHLLQPSAHTGYSWTDRQTDRQKYTQVKENWSQPMILITLDGNILGVATMHGENITSGPQLVPWCRV